MVADSIDKYRTNGVRHN